MSDAVISTSLYEWYGRQIFEWYLYSKNVITSDVSDVKKIFKWDKSVYIVNNPYDTQKYCNDINNILNSNQSKRITSIQGSKEEIKEYYEFLKA